MTSNQLGYTRTVVYVRRNRNEAYVPADFDECLMDYFGIRKGYGRIECTMEDNVILLQPPLYDRRSSNNKNVSDGEMERLVGCRFQHPSFCVAHKLTDDARRELPPEIRDRGVDVGVSVLIESSDGRLLITRRASHMRTFPGVWVPPGGHVEEGETMQEVAARELMEETGLTLEPEEYESFRMLGLWESMYPPVLYRGAPKRHHLVIYLHGKLPYSTDELQDRLKLDCSEVDALVWLTRKMVEVSVYGSKEKKEEAIPITIVNKYGEHGEDYMNSKVLRKKMPEPDQEIERLTTGTRYALRLWLEDQEEKTI